MSRAAKGCNQKDIALIRGRAKSAAPSCSGIIQFAKPLIMGIAARKIMVVPWRVKNWLYCSCVRKSFPGTASWIRIIIAMIPPTPRKNKPATKYSVPIFL